MKMSSKLVVISIFLLFLSIFSADKVFPGWFRHYGGTDQEFPGSIQQTSDGGYVLVGETLSFSYGSYDYTIYKLDSDGSKVWFKHYGGNNGDHGRSIQQIPGGGYIVAGSIESFTYGLTDFGIYKLDSSGNKIWFKHYGGTNNDDAYSIQQTSDGGYIVAGKTESFTYGNSDIAIYKLNSSGNKVWFKHYGGTNGEQAYSIQQTSEGGYIVAGYSNSFSYGNSDIAIYKLNSSGNKVWFKHYGGTNNDYGQSVQQTSDGGYIVAGWTYSYTYGGTDFAIFKLDSNGNKIWFKHYGGTSNDYAYSIQQTSDGGYVVAGLTGSYTYGSNDFAIYKLNSSGNKNWFKHYGGTNSDAASSIQQTSDGGYITTGYIHSYSHGMSDFGIYRLDSNGDK